MYSSRALHNSKYSKRRKKQKIRAYAIVVGLFAVIVALFSYIFHVDTFRIRDVSAKGTTLVSPKDVESLIRADLDGSYWSLIPRDNAFLYPASQIKDKILSTFNSIDTVMIQRKSLRELEITLTERKTYALGCVGNPDISGVVEDDDETVCMAIDKKGLAFIESPDFSAGVYTKFFNRKKGSELKLGSTVLTPAELAGLESVAKLFASKKYTVTGMVLADEGWYEAHLKGVSGRMTVVFFDDHDGFEKAEKNIGLFLDERRKVAPGAGDEFEYIDARYGNSIYYKIYGSKADTSDATAEGTENDPNNEDPMRFVQ